MARPTPPGNGAQRPVVLGAGKQSADPLGQQFGASRRTMAQISRFQDEQAVRDAMALTGDVYDEQGFMGALSQSNPNLYPTFNRPAEIQEAIFKGTAYWKYYEDEEGNRVRPPKFITNEYYRQASTALGEQGYQVVADGYYFQGQNPREGVTEDAASALTDIPTSSTNYRRPRTVAAGYDTVSKTLTVVFRDGTFYNYYNVPSDVWIRFHDSFSKGPMLNRKNKNQGSDGVLLGYERGVADLSNLSETAQEFLYKVARTAQIYYAGSPNIKRRGRNLNKAYNQQSSITASQRAVAGKPPTKGGKNPFQK